MKLRSDAISPPSPWSIRWHSITRAPRWQSSSGRCTPPAAAANARAPGLFGLIGRYMNRGLAIPERRTPAIPSIAFSRPPPPPSPGKLRSAISPAGQEVKSKVSCHSTDSPTWASCRARLSHGPTIASSSASAGAVLGLMQTRNPQSASSRSRATATRSGASVTNGRVSAHQSSRPRSAIIAPSRCSSPTCTSSIRYSTLPSQPKPQRITGSSISSAISIVSIGSP